MRIFKMCDKCKHFTNDKCNIQGNVCAFEQKSNILDEIPTSKLNYLYAKGYFGKPDYRVNKEFSETVTKTMEMIVGVMLAYSHIERYINKLIELTPVEEVEDALFDVVVFIIQKIIGVDNVKKY